MNKNIFGIAVLAFSLLFGQAVFADKDSQESSQPCGCGHMKMKKMIASLKLDSAQQAKIKSIREQSKESIKSDAQQMKSLSSELDQLVQSDNMDQSKLDDLVGKKKDLIGKMIKSKIMAKQQMYAVLNPQQKTQFQHMMKQWAEKKEAFYKKCHDEE